jgi:hypothetical protein
MRPQRINRNAAKVAEAAYEVARLRFRDGSGPWHEAPPVIRALWMAAALEYVCSVLGAPVPPPRRKRGT